MTDKKRWTFVIVVVTVSVIIGILSVLLIN
jgi:hypothetical protein